jgi:hypothetical protein
VAQIKGTAILDSLAAIRARSGEEELKSIVGGLGDDAKRLFERPVYPATWYPLDLFVEFLEADVNQTAGGNREVLITRSEKVIEKQLHGIYKMFVKLGSPEFIIKRIAVVHSTYFQGVKILTEFQETKRATIKYFGFAKNQQIMEYAIIGFYRKALEISGAKDVQARFTQSIANGSDFATLTITWS